jgi:hypothetical protein
MISKILYQADISRILGILQKRVQELSLNRNFEISSKTLQPGTINAQVIMMMNLSKAP